MLGAVLAPSAAAATGWHGLGWDLPKLQATASVTGTAGADRPIPPAQTVADAGARPAAVSWPAAASTTVDLPATAAGGTTPAQPAKGLPMTLARPAAAAHAAGRVTVSTVDHSVAERAGIAGTLMKVTGTAGDPSGPISVSVDYRSFANAYGADFGRRLRLVTYPDCVLTTPTVPACRQATPLNSANSAKTDTVSAEVALPVTPTGAAQHATAQSTAVGQDAVVGAVSGANSGEGDFTATNLSPSGTWAQGGSSGDFTYSYPISVPTAANGAAPTLALDYDSGSVDGLTSATNNQSSWIGDGWDLSAGGFIERSYKPCAQDLGGNNNQTKTGDECWAGDNATLELGKANGPLVRIGTTNQWRLRNDDGTRIEKLTGAANGAQGGEYWRVTTPDGIQYFFGLNHLPGWQSGNPETQSTWTVPVFGNNAGEPCHQATFAASWCQQAWRWNLDYVVDPDGNATVYYYTPETNYYGLNLNYKTAGTVYTRGGYLARIEYGLNTTNGGVLAAAPNRILFDTAERCQPSGAVTCDAGQLTKDTAADWPDVPQDQICAAGAVCQNLSPAYFSRKRLTTITTQVTNGSGGWNSVNQWSLAQSFPVSGDGNSPSLWLASVTRTGLVGGSLSLPATTFGGTAMANRVDATENYTALTRYRLTSIVNDVGGVTAVKYSAPECVTGTKMPAAPETDTLRCFAAYWTPGGSPTPVQDWFNKYVVTDVTNDGRTALAPQTLTHYDYSTAAAWHYDDDTLADPKYRSWSQWRGYDTVKTTTGEPNDPSGPQTVTQNVYLRGMDGDTLPANGVRSATVTDSRGETIPDSKQLAGFTRETQTYLDGKIITSVVNDPWISAATATDSTGRQAFLTGIAGTRTQTWLAASNTWRTTQKLTTFNDQGLPTQVETDGDVSDPNQATCARTSYAQNTDAWLLKYADQVTTVTGTCAASNQPTSANIVSDKKDYYDGQGFGAAPTAGRVTQEDTLDSWPAGGAEVFQSPSTTTTYDGYGRVTASSDALHRTTTTTYTPATGAPLTQVTTTKPPVSATDNTTFSSTRYLDPVSGGLLAEVNDSGLRTDATYDPLGRLTAVWKPGHAKSADAPADLTYAYTVNTDSPGVVTTNTLRSDGRYNASYELIDGLGRTVQTQAPTAYAQGGRTITDTLYDSQGRTWKTHDSYWNSAAPATSLLVVQDNAVPSTTVTDHDSAGRTVASVYELHGTEQWRTTTSYDGDRVTTVPPAGGTATSTVTDGLGRKVQYLQFHDVSQTGPGAAADVTSYTYTPTGQIASTTDSTGKNTWSYTYNAHDDKLTSTDPDSGKSSFTYDAAGQQLTSTDARGDTVAYTYDNLGRKTGVYAGSTSGARLASWTYDTLLPDQPTSSTSYVNGAAYTTTVVGYDSAGRPTGSRVTVPMSENGLGGSYQFDTTYDPLTGAVATTTSPGRGGLPPETIYHQYDQLGNPTALKAVDTSGDTTVLVSETDYNATGQVLRTNYQDPANPNQVSVTNTYQDGTNRLASTLAERATTTGHAIADKVYTYDAAGDPTSVADTPQGSASDFQCFGYDYLRRVTQAWTPSTSDCTAAPSVTGLGGAAPYWTSWTYDQTGNRTGQVTHAAAGDTTSTSTYPSAGTTQPHALQQISTSGPAGNTTTAYQYDTAGDTTGRGAQTYTYDTMGRLATATDAHGASSYVYDATGTRMITKDPTGETLTVGDLELTVPKGSSNASGTRYYTFGDHQIAERGAQSGLTWLLTDSQGTVYAAVTASSLAVTKRWQDPYGNQRGPVNPWPDQHGFLGDTVDDTGLTHVDNRDYDPSTGRFMTVDPVLDNSDPQQMNGYSYADDNPVTKSDPTGLDPVPHACDDADNVFCHDYYYTGQLPGNGSLDWVSIPVLEQHHWKWGEAQHDPHINKKVYPHYNPKTDRPWKNDGIWDVIIRWALGGADTLPATCVAGRMVPTMAFGPDDPLTKELAGDPWNQGILDRIRNGGVPKVGGAMIEDDYKDPFSFKNLASDAAKLLHLEDPAVDGGLGSYRDFYRVTSYDPTTRKAVVQFHVENPMNWQSVGHAATGDYSNPPNENCANVPSASGTAGSEMWQTFDWTTTITVN